MASVEYRRGFRLVCFPARVLRGRRRRGHQASTSEGILAPAESADWNHSGDCWSWSYTEDQCTLTYEVCETEDGYDWTVTFNGNCGGDPVHDWLAMDGHTNADATEGVLHFYNEGETTPGLSVTWTRAEDDLSGTWNFYEGEVDEANLTAVLNWEKISDSSGHMDWVWLEQAKWELDYADNGGSGTMEMYEWSEGSWELNMEIVWNMDGTGHWTIYENGQVTETTSW